MTPKIQKLFRAYDPTTEWMGAPCETQAEALGHATAHNQACAAKGGTGAAEVVRKGESNGRCMRLDGTYASCPRGSTETWRGGVRWR